MTLSRTRFSQGSQKRKAIYYSVNWPHISLKPDVIVPPLQYAAGAKLVREMERNAQAPVAGV